MRDRTRSRLLLAMLIAAAVLVLPDAPVASGQDKSVELPPPRNASVAPPSGTGGPLGLPDLIEMGLAQNPRLRQAEFDIDAAAGRAHQAGLYPNPTLTLSGEEIGKGGGIHTLPQLSQEIVTAGKLDLSRAAAEKQIDQATLALTRQRFDLFAVIRQGYFEVLTLQRRITVLEELVKIAEQGYENARKLLAGKLIAELDVLPFEVERDRLRADLDATHRELFAAWQRLAASIGNPCLPLAPLSGSLESSLPPYDFMAARAFVLKKHPDVLSAEVGVSRAQLVLRREEVEPIPNVTLTAGYQRNFNDRENQAMYQVGIPIPVWNRNQGSIRASQAELARATKEVARVQNDLVNRLGAAFGTFSAAQQRAERYRAAIIPNARRAYQLSLNAFRGGQFEYLRVIQAQRSIAEANLEYIRALSDAWRGASELSGLLLEEHWPLLPAPEKHP